MSYPTDAKPIVSKTTIYPPVVLKETLQAMAKRERRSLNQQIVYMLEQYLETVEVADG